MEFIGFADVKKFVEISGISKDDFEKKFHVTKGFKKHVCIDLVKVPNVTSKSIKESTISKVN